jgi:ABC-type nitrate/sulfonate/bicarbonate transport system substrate-binding protein
MRDLRTPLAAAIGIGLCLGAMPVHAQQAALKMTLFGQPSVNNDSIWMAFEKGLYQQEGLDVTYRLFPSGTTAFQAFQTGQGDIVMTGDLPSVQYFFRAKGDYRTIAVIERDAKGYVAVARKEITKPQDLVGKTVATRVGSTGSWFISEYLTKNGVDPSKVTVKNLDTQVLPAALCGGDIAAFFIWQPVGSRTLEICPDKAHYLTDATGYIQGYLVAGARPEWLASPQGKDIATRLIKFGRVRGFDLQPELERIYKKDEAALARLFGLSLRFKKFDRNVRAYGQVVYSCFTKFGETDNATLYLKVLDRQ